MRVLRGRDQRRRIGDGEIEEGGCEQTFHCLILTEEKCRFTVPPAVALLNCISCGILWRIFCQTRIFRGVFLFIICRKEQRSCDWQGTLYFQGAEQPTRVRWMGRGAGNIIYQVSLVPWKDIRLWQLDLFLKISRGFLCIFRRRISEAVMGGPRSSFR